MKVEEGGAQDNEDKLRGTPAVKENAGEKSQPIPIFIRDNEIRQKKNR